MISTTIIITFCCLLLLAYVFDITASRTRVPAVILLLLSGWLVKQLCELFKINIPDLKPLLPVLGSVGLILIVLEGALELELNKHKKKVVALSALSALLPILALAFLFSWLLSYYFGYGHRQSMINVLPLCVISSSIAISSGRNLNNQNREFIVYESSLSDIFGVLLFNFVLLNSTITSAAVFDFSVQFLLILVVSFFATAGLSLLLSRINHHIKFAPIILLVILIYEVSKVYNLPALIFILLFGLFLGNLEEFKKVKWIQRLNPQELDLQVRRFKEIVVEATFLIRSLFFLLFGYLITNEQILNLDTFTHAVIVVGIIFIVRAVTLKLTGSPVIPLLFIAPRGLITILLFFAIDPSMKIAEMNDSLVLQVILLTAVIMMIGLMVSGKGKSSLSERVEVTD